MELVREKEVQAERFAHIMDDAIHIPGTRIRFGIDPILSLIPVFGDILTVFCGSFILLSARQLGIPQKELARMMYYQALNGFIGAIPVVGDLYSFGYKGHAKNSAVLVSALKKPEDSTCQITAPALSLLPFAQASHTVAKGINDAGQIVGHYADQSLATHGFLNNRGAFTSLDVPFADSRRTQALGINNSGQIVGIYVDGSTSLVGSETLLHRIGP